MSPLYGRLRWVGEAVASLLAETGRIQIGGPETEIRITADILADGSRLRLSVPTVAGRNYVVEWAETLLEPNWNVLNEFEGNGTVRVVEDRVSSSAQRFYRVRWME